MSSSPFTAFLVSNLTWGIAHDHICTCICHFVSDNGIAILFRALILAVSASDRQHPIISSSHKTRLTMAAGDGQRDVFGAVYGDWELPSLVAIARAEDSRVRRVTAETADELSRVMQRVSNVRIYRA